MPQRLIYYLNESVCSELLLHHRPSIPVMLGL
jgi:hypothetical protein